MTENISFGNNDLQVLSSSSDILKPMSLSEANTAAGAAFISSAFPSWTNFFHKYLPRYTPTTIPYHNCPHQTGTRNPAMTSKKSTEEVSKTLRPFTNVNELDGFKRRKGSEIGCAALISGTTVGAGVLALPASTAEVGFIGSSFALLMVWAYMVASALLIAEVSVETSCMLGRSSGVSLLGMADVVFGRGALRAFIGFVYGGLHYAILTAYVAQGGAVTRDASGIFSQDSPAWLSQAVFAGLLGCIVYFGSEKITERVNSILVAGVVTSFAVLAFSAGKNLDLLQLLTTGNLAKIPKAVPVLFVSLVFHNVVSNVTARLEGDFTKIRRVVVGGSLVPVVIFVIWNAVILNLASELKAPAGSVDPLELLRVQGGEVSELINAFSLFAISTSLIGFLVSLGDFVDDVRKTVFGEQPESVSRTRWLSFASTIVPPVIIAGTKPDIFYSALDTAGLYFISVLFGAVPALLAWRQRDQKGEARILRSQVKDRRLILVGMVSVPLLLIGSKIISYSGLQLP